MDFVIIQVPENGILGGPKEIQFDFLHDGIDYKVSIVQCGKREVTISSPLEAGSAKNSLIVFYNLETLLMLFDGQFYPICNAFENGQEVTHSMQMRTLTSFKSADFMMGAGNVLGGYENVLSATLLEKWFCLMEELDLIHKMVLYCLSSADIPVDMKCAFMIEAFLGIGELINKQKADFPLPSIGKNPMGEKNPNCKNTS